MLRTPRHDTGLRVDEGLFQENTHRVSEIQMRLGKDPGQEVAVKVMRVNGTE